MVRRAVRNGKLVNNTIRPEYKGEYPESARLDGSTDVTLRFRLERIAAGATEYIPPIFVVGAIEKERAFFSLKYIIAASVGGALSGQCDYDIEFNGLAEVGKEGKKKDEEALRKYSDVIILRDMLLRAKW